MANEQRRGMGRRMGGAMAVEKPKDFKGSIGKLVCDYCGSVDCVNMMQK